MLDVIVLLLLVETFTLETLSDIPIQADQITRLIAWKSKLASTWTLLYLVMEKFVHKELLLWELVGIAEENHGTILTTVHAVHPGGVSMKALIRSYIWSQELTQI